MLRDRIAFQRKKKSTSSNKQSQLAKKDQSESRAQEMIISPMSTPSNVAATPVLSNTNPPSFRPVGIDFPPQLSNSLSLPMEDTVSSLFFNSYSFLPKDPLMRLGYMELLPIFYYNASYESPLRLAVQAVSYFSMAAWTGQRSFLRSAEQSFMKAVSRTRLALQENIDHQVEETLMAILLFSTFEVSRCTRPP